MDHRHLVENRIDIDPHLLLGKIIYQFKVTVSDRIHKRVPVVRSRELVYEMRESVEKVYDLLCVALF